MGLMWGSVPAQGSGGGNECTCIGTCPGISFSFLFLTMCGFYLWLPGPTEPVDFGWTFLRIFGGDREGRSYLGLVIMKLVVGGQFCFGRALFDPSC